MMMLVTRPYTDKTDLQPIADLLNACEAVDQFGNYYSASELQIEFSAPQVDPHRDIRLWEDAAGTLIAFAQLWMPPSANPVDGYLWFRVHPSARTSRVDVDIIAWGESRLRQVGLERSVPVQLRASARTTQSDRIALLKQCGFEIDRDFLTLGRSLTEALPVPQLPEGMICRPTQGKLEVEAWVDLFNQSFIDHWNYHATTVECRLHALDHPQHRPELDLVAVAADGTLAGFCYGFIDADCNQQQGVKEGWIYLLGVRRGFRRMGLGRALLLSGLQGLQAAGMSVAKLGVDTQNPNQAQHLYESVGFQTLYGNLSFVKDL